ncbi:MAG: hypothetical protein QOJ79_2466 [Actinomycetota bacterium]|jgi:uncharacterized protein (TIGR03084 family)|nr:hypothetical protein [Actinomycetota bacterium]
MNVIDDLAAEQQEIDHMVAGLDDDAWQAPSGAAGWSIADVLLHLAQSEESVLLSTKGRSLADALPDALVGATSMDDMMDRWVASERAPGQQVLERWRTARAAAVAALRAADPDVRLPWAAAPLKPAALATTRLAEHWAHALDIAEGLRVPYPDTDRLRHIAWLAHRTLPYAFTIAGEEPHDVYCELTAPDGLTVWTFGDPETDGRIEGSAGAFCRVGAQRISPEDSGLSTTGRYAEAALRVLRNYAA